MGILTYEPSPQTNEYAIRCLDTLVLIADKYKYDTIDPIEELLLLWLTCVKGRWSVSEQLVISRQTRKCLQGPLALNLACLLASIELNQI